MFQAQGEQDVIRQQHPQQQNLQTTSPMPVQSFGQPMVAQPYPYPVQGMPMQQMGMGMPMQQMGMGMQPQYAVAAVPLGVVHPTRGMWSDGLCDCFNDCESCLLSWVIPPYLFGRTVQRSGLGEFFPSFMMYFVPWLTLAVLWIIFFSRVVAGWALIVAIVGSIVCAIVGCLFRGRMRQKYSIPGDQMEDCCVHCCCVVCALSQEARHANRANAQTNAPVMGMQPPMGIYNAPQPQQQMQQQQPVFAQPPQPSGYPSSFQQTGFSN